ncbi:MAG: hypothetical protein M3Y45_01835 [Actinomycetota bacterium]|nr:hypothetical protein [Actinomycetota bacterium]
MRGRPLRLDVGLLLAALGGFFLLILMFSDWYSISASAPVAEDAIGVGVGRGWDAWTSFAWIDLILLLTVVVAIGSAVLSVLQARLPVRPGAILTALGGLSFLLVLYRLISPPWDDAGREAAPWLSLLCLAAVVGGGYLSNRLQSGRRNDAPKRRESSEREKRRSASRRGDDRGRTRQSGERRPAGTGFSDHNAGGGRH